MTPILQNLISKLSGGEAEKARIRRVLLQCENERARVEISRASGKGKSGQQPIVASIAQVRHDDFSVLCASRQHLAPGESVSISIFSSNGCTTFRSKVLSGCRVLGDRTEGESGGIRLGIPERLKVVNLRSHVRVPVDPVGPIHVSLHVEPSGEAIRGLLRDLSLSGARVEVDGSVTVLKGRRVIMMGELPRPGGAIAEPGRVARVERYPRSGRVVIGLAFDEEATALHPFVRFLEAQQAQHGPRGQHMAWRSGC